MRRSLFGALLGAGLVIAATAGRGSSEPAFGGPGEAINVSPLQDTRLFSQVTAENGQPLTVTVIDPQQRAMAIYHVDRATGEIALRSVRNLNWDLQMVQYNSASPLPQDIRNGLQRP
jgi:hypothetical protein